MIVTKCYHLCSGIIVNDYVTFLDYHVKKPEHYIAETPAFFAFVIVTMHPVVIRIQVVFQELQSFQILNVPILLLINVLTPLLSLAVRGLR